MTTTERLLQQLEALERGATGPPAETSARIWGAIESRLATGPAPPELDSGPLLSGAKPIVLQLIGVAVIVGLIGGGLALSRSPTEPPPVVATRSAAAEAVEPEPALEPEPAIAPAPIVEEVEEVEAEPEAEPKPPEPGEGATTRKLAPKPAPTVAPKSLADEVALMQALSTALKQGHSSKVLGLVAEHERDFAAGQFIEERQAAKARGLCQSGKLAAGQKLAASFASRWPTSIHLAAVTRDCGDG